MRGSTPNDPWVWLARNLDMGYMSRSGEFPLDVPDGLMGFMEMFTQKASSIIFGEYSSVSPPRLLESPNVE